MTLIIRIEGILNSRPLVAISTDPNDLSVLTLGHFLIGQPIMVIPEHDISDIPQNRLSRWQLMRQALLEVFLEKMEPEVSPYITKSIEVVSSKSQSLCWRCCCKFTIASPLAWQLGRVIQVHPGADQVVRVATVKTSEGTLKRSVVKLVKLPTDNA
jgi:hypothetical protein